MRSLIAPTFATTPDTTSRCAPPSPPRKVAKGRRIYLHPWQIVRHAVLPVAHRHVLPPQLPTSIPPRHEHKTRPDHNPANPAHLPPHSATPVIPICCRDNQHSPINSNTWSGAHMSPKVIPLLTAIFPDFGPPTRRISPVNPHFRPPGGALLVTKAHHPGVYMEAHLCALPHPDLLRGPAHCSLTSEYPILLPDK